MGEKETLIENSALLKEICYISDKINEDINKSLTRVI